MSRGEIRHEALEQRLRDALEARANSAGLEHLRPAALPTVTRRPLLPPRRAVIVLFGLAAAAAFALLFLTNSTPDRPVGPAVRPTRSVSPPASQVPASPATPSPSHRGAAATEEGPDPASTATRPSDDQP
ncbi:levansucrase [Streptomyces azureus]|uniref:Levansucrase n=1 Tax=Streptomyces azureus TaxID=146537 RepID=A0A0K8PDN8_STRAJ|nr:levansucrase [Streptomyces azureus]